MNVGFHFFKTFVQSTALTEAKVMHEIEKDGHQYISATAIRTTFGVSPSTLRNWAKKGEIDVVRFGGNGKRLYRLSDVERFFKGYSPHHQTVAAAIARQKARICYARVSSPPQKGDLARQVESLQKAFPDHEIVKDIGSGLNWKRPGLLAILDRALQGTVQEVVVSHRDRLCRFAFELLRHVLERSGCRIVVQHSGVDGSKESESELRDDLLAIVTCFVASNNGKRAAANKRERKCISSREEEEQADGDEEQEVGAPPDQGSEGKVEAMD